MMQLNGREGVPQNFKLGFDLIQKSAIQGLTVAQNRLGLFYYTGIEGILPQNYNLALLGLTKRLSKDLLRLNSDYQKCTEKEKEPPENNKLANFWYQKSQKPRN